MQDARTTFKKLVQLGALAYLLVAILYTTTYFVAYPLSTLATSVLGLGDSVLKRGTSAKDSLAPRVDLIGQTLYGPVLAADDDKHTFLNSFLTADDLLHQPNTDPGDYLALPIREETFLSKAFSQAMHPTKIIPFFYRASGPIDEGDVTITTLVTSNRFPVLKKLVERYRGVFNFWIVLSLLIHVK